MFMSDTRLFLKYWMKDLFSRYIAFAIKGIDVRPTYCKWFFIRVTVLMAIVLNCKISYFICIFWLDIYLSCIIWLNIFFTWADRCLKWWYSLSDRNEIGNHNHLLRTGTLNHLVNLNTSMWHDKSTQLYYFFLYLFNTSIDNRSNLSLLICKPLVTYIL